MKKAASTICAPFWATTSRSRLPGKGRSRSRTAPSLPGWPGATTRWRKAPKPSAVRNPSWPGRPRTGSSSWSRTRENTPRPAAGGSVISRTANLPTRPCTTRAFPATRSRMPATLSSTVMPREGRTRRANTMATDSYDKEITALLVVDPYNDFISEGGKLWGRIRAVAEANDCVPHMLQVLNAARQAKLRVFYAVHHRYRPGDYETWKYVAPVQRAAWKHKSFEYGTWGGEIRAEFEPKPGEIVATEHWCSSGFANTDLDLQLKKHGIHQLIVIGLIAHTCIEATVRFAAELGYDVTVIRDAVADYSDEDMHAALDVNLPNYASAIVSTEEIVASISALGAAGLGPRPRQPANPENLDASS